MAEQDPFDFLLEVSEIPRSQEDLLRGCAFVGEPVNAGNNAAPSPSRASPENQGGLLMFSMPETQDVVGNVATGGSGTQEPEDVFHTPPEKSSAPSSGDLPPVDHCKLNHELDVHDDETLGFLNLGDSQGVDCVNLGKDCDLGFSELQLSQKAEEEMVAQSPRGTKRDDSAEKFEDSLCIGELPVKKSKLSEPTLVPGSSRDCLMIESQAHEVGNAGNCKVVGDVEPEKEEEDQNKKKNFVFDVLKFLAENTTHDKKDGNDDGGGKNASLEDVLKSCGFDFPRPRWR